MVDLGGYVIILVEREDKKIKLYGSPADKDNLEVGDEILEVNGKNLEDCTHTEVINHIHQCIRSRTICLRVKRRSGARLDLYEDSISSPCLIRTTKDQSNAWQKIIKPTTNVSPLLEDFFKVVG